jgi:hypothetical protein
MKVYRDRKRSEVVASLPDTLATLAARLEQEQQGWRERLLQDPARFGEIEVSVHQTFQTLADEVLAGLLGEVGQASELEQAWKKSR